MNIISIEKMYKQKFTSFEGLQTPWIDVFGSPEDSGIWLIFGKEKNGKTKLALLLASMLSAYKKVLYISAEEGIGKAFTESCKMANIGENTNLGFLEYIPLFELVEKLKQQRSAEVIFLDNVTIYNSELQKGFLKKMVDAFPRKLFVFIAHEERKEPYTSSARLIQKLAKVIMHVEGLACVVGGRVPGGKITIDESKAKVFFGDDVNEI